MVAGTLLGCSTESSQQWLSVFFDGVPGAGGTGTNEPAIQYDENGRPLATTPPPTINEGLGVEPPKFTTHPPYEERNCTACHESKFSVKLNAPQTQMCLLCHDDFFAKAKSKHFPAEENDCIACHNPHGSPDAHMLQRTGKALCAECHEMTTAKAKSTHKPVAAGECLTCHNPHASAQEKLLRKEPGKLCMECHSSLLANKKFRHSPADSGDCLTCHQSHEADQPTLLKKAMPALCFDCHDKADVEKISDHKDITECAACHDPHASDLEKYLK